MAACLHQICSRKSIGCNMSRLIIESGSGLQLYCSNDINSRSHVSFFKYFEL